MKPFVMLAMMSAILAAALITQAHADTCDFASLSRGSDVQSRIVSMVNQAVSDALVSKQIPVATSKVEIASQNGCYPDGNNQTVYQIRVQVKVTTARGNVLELFPLVYDSNGPRTFQRFDNEGARLPDGSTLEFDLEAGYPTESGPSDAVPLTNVATQYNVIDDMHSIPSFKDSITIVDSQ